MAEAQGKSNNKDSKKQSGSKRPKKVKTQVSLPNARKSIRRQRAMAQGKASFEGWMGLIGGILVALLILFILLGGINQRKFIETMGTWGQTIGTKINSWLHPEKIITNDDGIYYNMEDGDPLGDPFAEVPQDSSKDTAKAKK